MDKDITVIDNRYTDDHAVTLIQDKIDSNIQKDGEKVIGTSVHIFIVPW